MGESVFSVTVHFANTRSIRRCSAQVSLKGELNVTFVAKVYRHSASSRVTLNVVLRHIAVANLSLCKIDVNELCKGKLH